MLLLRFRCNNLGLAFFNSKRTILTEKEAETLHRSDWYTISKIWLERMYAKENMSKKEINEKISYLFPSGLFCKDARPVLDSSGLFRKKSSSGFSEDGSPVSHGYFTQEPGYNDVIYETLRRLYAIGELPAFDGDKPPLPNILENLDLISERPDEYVDPETNKAETYVVRWLTCPEFTRLVGKTRPNKKQYQICLELLKKLYDCEKSYLFMDFLSQFIVVKKTKEYDFEAFTKDENGYIRTTGKRKHSIADVFVREGNNKSTINGLDVDKFFEFDYFKMLLYAPLDAVRRRNDFEFVANVIGGGPSTQAMAIRLAIAKSLPFFNRDYLEIMESSRLSEMDCRRPERKKFGKHSARRSYKTVKR